MTKAATKLLAKVNSDLAGRKGLILFPREMSAALELQDAGAVVVTRYTDGFFAKATA